MWSILFVLSFLLIPVQSKDTLCQNERSVHEDYFDKIKAEYRYHQYPIEALDKWTDLCLDVVKCELKQFASSGYKDDAVAFDTMRTLGECLHAHFRFLPGFRECYSKIYMQLFTLNFKHYESHKGGCGFKDEDFLKIEEIVRGDCDMDAWLDFVKNEERVKELICRDRF